MREDASPWKQHCTMKILQIKFKEEMNKLLEIAFVYKIKHMEWVCLIVIVPRKNVKLQVCVNLDKVNLAIVPDHYPLPSRKH